MSSIRTTEKRELRLQISIKSVQSEVTRVVETIIDWLSGHKVEQETTQDLELVLAEALNNVVEHAYVYKEDGEIEVLILLQEDELSVTITDSGRKFRGPPPLKETNGADFELENLPEGGFGWNLIRSLTDKIEFEHSNKKNRLQLTRML